MSETWKQWEGRTVDGRFPLQSYLGGSDHSAVFLTLMQSAAGDSEKAAIKLISAGAADAEKQLFRWKAARELNHPNLIRIFEAGRCQLDSTDLLYVVEEYAEENLSQILPERALTAEEVRALLPPVLEALQFVHEKGFVHGHIQPSNILAIGDQVKLSSDALQRAGREEPPRGSDERLRSARSGDGCGFDGCRRLAVGNDVGRGADAALAGLGSCTDERAGGTGDGSGTIPRDRGALLASGCGEAMDACGDQRSAVSQRGLDQQRRRLRPSSDLSSADRGSAENICEMALLAGVSGAGCGCDLFDCETETIEPADGSAIDASAAGCGGRKLPVRHWTTTNADNQSGVVRRVMPQVSPNARQTIQGKIKVRVKVEVDAAGNVADATLESAGPSKYFSRLALEAAQGWKFSPAQAGEQGAAREWKLQFTFSRAGTECFCGAHTG